ncbi:putative acyl carrier protein [Achromobacter piechaudii ATCC 43553]|jgi:acyl carrier protein|nr:putative acyl carrier protein [Achromobacter piechaudii ATCC 43553]
MESTMHTREDIFNTLRDALVELFEIEPERVTPQANLYTDLEIDSIDAIDLIDHVRRQTGRKLDANDFRTVRTVEDVVQAMWQKQAPDA